MSAATSSLVTVDQYARLPEEEWRKYELSEGELVPRYGDEIGARLDHDLLRDEVRMALALYLRKEKRGIAVVEHDFRLSPSVIRRPDVAVVLTENKELIADAPAIVPGPPDLAVEVTSPSNLSDDIELKIRQLLDAGCRAIWLVHPRRQIVVVRTTIDRYEVGIDGVLDAPDLLPGFRLELRLLFASAQL